MGMMERDPLLLKTCLDIYLDEGDPLDRYTELQEMSSVLSAPPLQLLQYLYLSEDNLNHLQPPSEEGGIFSSYHEFNGCQWNQAAFPAFTEGQSSNVSLTNLLKPTAVL